MKKILVIAPSSYPVNSAEGIVNVKLLQVLSQNGFIIDLISKKSKNENYPSVSFDSYGLNLNSYHVIEVDNKINISTILGHIFSFFTFGIFLKGGHWALKAKKTVDILAKTTEYDYILTKDSPSFLLGYYIKKKHSLKWVATWNDPFPVVKYPLPYGLGVESKTSFFEKKTIELMRRYVDVHIFPSNRLRDYMNEYLHIPISNTRVIPHVIIKQFKTIKSTCTSNTLELIHSGNLGMPRNPKCFFMALRNFLNNNPKASVRVTLLGNIDVVTLNCIKENSLENFLQILPPISYEESLKKLQNYHVAVVIEADCKEGIFLPTKVSDFMQCHKPIFAISPLEGVLNDLYKENSISYFAPCSDSQSIELELGRLYNDFERGVLEHKFNLKKEYEPLAIVEQYKNL